MAFCSVFAAFKAAENKPFLRDIVTFLSAKAMSLCSPLSTLERLFEAANKEEFVTSRGPWTGAKYDTESSLTITPSSSKRAFRASFGVGFPLSLFDKLSVLGSGNVFFGKGFSKCSCGSFAGAFLFSLLDTFFLMIASFSLSKRSSVKDRFSFFLSLEDKRPKAAIWALMSVSFLSFG